MLSRLVLKGREHTYTHARFCMNFIEIGKMTMREDIYMWGLRYIEKIDEISDSRKRIPMHDFGSIYLCMLK